MKGYLAFLEKEWMEAIRNYKVFLMLIIFLILGIENPLMAKLTPVILENFIPEGMTVTIPEVSALDSWVQFYKNVPQIGLILLVVIFSGMLPNEINKGTLIPMVTKGLKRHSILLAKYSLAVLIWSISYLLCVAVSWAYTAYFWPADGLSHIGFGTLLVWLFGILLLAVLFLGGVLTSSSMGSLLVTGGLVVILFLCNLSPALKKMNPISLISDNMELIQGNIEISKFAIPVFVSCGLAILFIFLSCVCFSKKKL